MRANLFYGDLRDAIQSRAIFGNSIDNTETKGSTEISFATFVGVSPFLFDDVFLLRVINAKNDSNEI